MRQDGAAEFIRDGTEQCPRKGSNQRTEKGIGQRIRRPVERAVKVLDQEWERGGESREGAKGHHIGYRAEPCMLDLKNVQLLFERGFDGDAS